jgi:hypothetical protein
MTGDEMYQETKRPGRNERGQNEQGTKCNATGRVTYLGELGERCSALLYPRA